MFAVEWALHILVTGSSDGRLRVWNPYVPEVALAVLPPSPAPPAAILICPLRRVIITCDADAVSFFISHSLSTLKNSISNAMIFGVMHHMTLVLIQCGIFRRHNPKNFVCIKAKLRIKVTKKSANVFFFPCRLCAFMVWRAPAACRL